MKSQGYNNEQIAAFVGKSSKTVSRQLRINPELMCVDGTQTHRKSKLLDPYRKTIQELLEQGFNPSQILAKLRDKYPASDFKYSTLSDYCRELQAELFDFSQTETKTVSKPRENSMLTPHTGKITEMLEYGASIKAILAAITAEGYIGSYSLLQQYCRSLTPTQKRAKKNINKIKRKTIARTIWSGESELPEQDLSYIYSQYPALSEVTSIISEFRSAYSAKDVTAVRNWCAKYAQCDFQPIRSFINGVNADSEAFYNSIIYKYSNGLLEGSVNKLKAVKRTMFGRAGYSLLRAKLLPPPH